jgi:hypothetical protein
MLEGHQRGLYVGSLEPVPNDCFQVEKFYFSYFNLNFKYINRLKM